MGTVPANASRARSKSERPHPSKGGREGDFSHVRHLGSTQPLVSCGDWTCQCSVVGRVDRGTRSSRERSHQPRPFICRGSDSGRHTIVCNWRSVGTSHPYATEAPTAVCWSALGGRLRCILIMLASLAQLYPRVYGPAATQAYCCPVPPGALAF